MKGLFFSNSSMSFRQRLKDSWLYIHRWFLGTPERALEEAYKAAQNIKNIEIEHFREQKISLESVYYTDSIMSYWQVSLDKNLNLIKVRLSEFNLSRSVLSISDITVLEKLNFIDEVIAKYISPNQFKQNSALVTTTSQALLSENSLSQKYSDSSNSDSIKTQSANEKTGILPRSIGRTFTRILSDFNPDSEEDYLNKFRNSRNKTRITVRFIAILVVVPLLVQQLSKQIIFSPIIDQLRGENFPQIFLNYEMEEEGLHELQSFAEELKFERYLLKSPSLSPEKIEEKLKEKAIDIAKEFREKSSEAVSNVFADLFSLIAFAIVIATNKITILYVKSFIDDFIYGLSDSAKAFLIILGTDTFVGFHSPHGWEVILEGLAEHLGIPASQGAISLFIATFPVVLDTVFKYWIFRYLSRLSPSALATYKEMNE
jgi:CemA family